MKMDICTREKGRMYTGNRTYIFMRTWNADRYTGEKI